MKKILQNLVKHELIKGSFIIFAGSTIGNFFNYLFHLLTGRLLGPEKYGIIASLVSLLYIISLPSSLISTLVTRKVAALSAKDDLSAIKTVIVLVLKRILIINFLILVFFILFHQKIAIFLRIENSFLVLLLGLSFIIGLFGVVNMATLQGLLRLFDYIVIGVFSSALKDILALFAILLNFGALGVMWALVVVSFLSLLISFYPLRFIFRTKLVEKRITLHSYFSVFWVGSAIFGMSFMLSGDIMLVKHFFSSYESGLYAALSTMGKIVFFISSSLGSVLLPLAAKKKEKGETATKELFFAQSLAFAFSFAVIISYLLVPKAVILLFYGKSYFSIAPYLPLIGLYFLFYNLSFMFVNYFISMKKTGILLIPLLFAFSQTGMIYFFHHNFNQILFSLITIGALMFCVFFIYYLKYERIKI